MFKAHFCNHLSPIFKMILSWTIYTQETKILEDFFPFSFLVLIIATEARYHQFDHRFSKKLYLHMVCDWTESFAIICDEVLFYMIEYDFCCW